MDIFSFTFNPFQTNCFVCAAGGEAMIVDASPSTEGELRELTDFVDGLDARVTGLLLTHGHIDHIFGCAALAERYGLSWRIHPDDRPLLKHADQQASMFGLELSSPPDPIPDLADGQEISLGDQSLQVIHTPGHSPGSVSFFSPDDRVLISGDVLFAGSIGRTDLWQASLPELMRSIYDRVLPLGDDVRVLCGHGPETTIGGEKASNPFLQEPAPRV